MRSIRLFADTPLQPGLGVALPDSAAAHAVRVLRLRTGDMVTLFNGDGHEYPARLAAADAREVCAEITSRESPKRESSLRITLVQALARGEKMDWIIQKATELGAARIAPVVSERSEVKLDATRSEKRLGHWRAIAIAACEQCGRNTIPRIDAPVALDAWLAGDTPMESGNRWVLSPGGGANLRDPGPLPAKIIVAVGPEGGFGNNDLAALRQAGYDELALGPRILRTETAGIAALAALQALYGDF